MIKERVWYPRLRYKFRVYENKEHFLSKEKALQETISDNIVTLQGKNSINNVYFYDSLSVAYWYIVPFSSDTTCEDTMTYAVPVFTEYTTYDEASRPQWVPSVSADEEISNETTPAIITISTGGEETLYGCALLGGSITAATKANTNASGAIMYSASQFTGGSLEVSAGQLIAMWASITQA